MKIGRIALVVFLSLLVLSCATPYQPQGLTGGFSEQKISDSAFWVEFSGNGYASQDRVWNFWIYRCAELTLQNGYDYFTVRADAAPPQRASRRDAGIRPAVYDPNEVNRGRMIKVHGGGGYVYIPSYGGTGAAHWRSKGTVLMFHKPLPQEVLWAVNAQSVIEDLKAYVTSNGESTPPARLDVMKHAFTAHAQVGLGEGMKVSAMMAGAAASAASAALPASGADSATDLGQVSPQPRSAKGILDTVDSARLLFYQAFQDHVKRGKNASAGKIVVEFNVTANGYVTDCRLVSSTYDDAQLNDAIVVGLTRIQFAPASAAPTAVSNFAISFTPRFD